VAHPYCHILSPQRCHREKAVVWVALPTPHLLRSRSIIKGEVMPGSRLALLLLLLPTLLASWSMRGPYPMSAQLAHRAHPLVCQRTTAIICAVEQQFDFAFDDEEDEEEAEASRWKTSVDAVKLTDAPADNMTVAELQAQLKQLGQRHTGTKKELMDRVQSMQRKRALGIPLHDVQVQREQELRWYMLQTANGFERSVERTINMCITANRLQNQIERVWVPILEGETSVRENSVMPSYIFVRMQMDENLHFLISDMQYVINFVGSDRGGRSMSGQMQGNRGFVRPMPMEVRKVPQCPTTSRHTFRGDGAMHLRRACRPHPRDAFPSPLLPRSPLLRRMKHSRRSWH
jgi:hypothetical protein